MKAVNRREFMAGVGGTAAVLAANSVRGAEPASERVRIGVIGVRGRGSELIATVVKDPRAEIVAVCDIDDASFARPMKILESAGAKSVRSEKDFRKLLDDRTIDAVFVAAPDHWHALLTVMACQSGKDVYVEKPVSHNIVEGRRMVEAARKYARIVQAGTQRRSSPEIAEALEIVRSGGIGKVGSARTWIVHKRNSIGHGSPGPVPAGVDYAMWQGPAPDRPFYPNRFHYNWHWFWNWGTGELGNNGIHAIDLARWGLGLDAPTSIVSTGGNFVLDDDEETPDTQVAIWRFPTAILIWEHRIWSKHPIDGSSFGVSFEGDQGTLIIGEREWKVVEGKTTAGGKIADPQAAHIANFLECVKSRKKPNAEIEIGHLSTRLCHLGNVAQRVGRRVDFDASTERFVNDAEADKLLSREYGKRFEMPVHV